MFEGEEMIHTITPDNKKMFYLKSISSEDVSKARELCDECVGKNLYSEKDIASSIGKDDRFFYLINNEKGESIGYLYYNLTDIECLAEYSKLDVSVFREVYPYSNKLVGKIQSIGIKIEYRGIGLGLKIMQFVLNKLREKSIDIAFVFCWKPSNKFPIGRVIEECDFNYLTEANMIWYDNRDLICPFCHGRCICSAGVYYKMLDEETNNEA